MRRSYFVGTTLAVALVCMGTARAQNFDHRLKGTFSSTGMATCLVSIGGFNADLTPAPNSFSFTTTTSTVASAVFNGDGTGSDTAQEVTVVGSPVSGGSSDTTSFDFTYTVGPDRTVTVNVPIIDGQSLTGTLAGQSFTILNDAPSTGQLSEDRRSLTLATTDPVIDTITFSGGLVEQRICARSRVLIKVDEHTENR
jgi:hypothetical protein